MKSELSYMLVYTYSQHEMAVHPNFWMHDIDILNYSRAI